MGVFANTLDGSTTNNGDVNYSGGAGSVNGEEGCLQVGLDFEGVCVGNNII
jgi:hypothetical protein